MNRSSLVCSCWWPPPRWPSAHARRRRRQSFQRRRRPAIRPHRRARNLRLPRPSTIRRKFAPRLPPRARWCCRRSTSNTTRTSCACTTPRRPSTKSSNRLHANPGLRIRVAGHTDERGSDEYNIALGRRRAETAKRYLTDRGIDASRIETSTFGRERPAMQGSSEERGPRTAVMSSRSLPVAINCVRRDD